MGSDPDNSKQVLRKPPQFFLSIHDGFEKNNVINDSGLVDSEGDGHGQGGGDLWGWGEGGGLADGGQGLVVEEGVAAAGEDAQVADRSVRGDGEGDLNLAAPAAAIDRQQARMIRGFAMGFSLVRVKSQVSDLS